MVKRFCYGKIKHIIKNFNVYEMKINKIFSLSSVEFITWQKFIIIYYYNHHQQFYRKFHIIGI